MTKRTEKGPPCSVCNALIVPRNATHYDAEDLAAAEVRAKIIYSQIRVEGSAADQEPLYVNDFGITVRGYESRLGGLYHNEDAALSLGGPVRALVRFSDVADKFAAQPVADLPAPEPLTSDQKYWLARRADIIAALEARGLQIWSDKDRVWLHDMGGKPA